MVDDLGYIPDDRVLKRLPDIRRLWLQGGTRFTQMYTETPLCCPARANFLTGQHTLHHGVVRNDGDLLDPRKTVAVTLQGAGYHTIMVGKYFNQYDGDKTPDGWDRISIMGPRHPTRFWVDGTLLSFGDQFKQDVIRETAVEWLRDSPLDRPVFGWITPSAPHKCRQRSNPGVNCRHPLVMKGDQGASACEGIPDFKPPSYRLRPLREGLPGTMPNWPDGWKLTEICESLLVVDRMVGELVEAQRARGRPAYFLLMSDNGMAWGQKGFPTKYVPSATRLPFYITGPGIGSGRVDQALSNIDVAPTIADIAGDVIPWADGVSLLPALEGATVSGRDEILEIMPRSWSAIRTPGWRYIHWQDGSEELYELGKDPWELHDLVDRRPAKARSMKQRLDLLIEDSRR